VAGRARRLYPVGETDEDDFLRCGIPRRSHMRPEFGCQINACDREMHLSLAGKFRCSDDPAMPKSPWCFDARFVGRRVCSEHSPLRAPGTFAYCHIVGGVARAYQAWKVRSTCSRVAEQVPLFLPNRRISSSEEPRSHLHLIPAAGPLSPPPSSLAPPQLPIPAPRRSSVPDVRHSPGESSKRCCPAPCRSSPKTSERFSDKFWRDTPGGTDPVVLTRRAAPPPQNIADIRALLSELEGAGAAPRAWGRLLRDVGAALLGGVAEPGGGARGDLGSGRTIQWNCSCPGADAPAPGVS
jgi:hypothetical protein